MPMPHWKYRPYATVDLPDRTWPDRVVDRAPIWCSTDLRDGNQALVNPMDAARKRRFFDLLLALGVPEIEVGLPLGLEDRLRLRPAPRSRTSSIPDDTTIAVLTQARPELIERTFEAIAGARARDRPPLQLDVGHAAPRRLPARQGRDHRPRGTRDPAVPRRSPPRAPTEIVFQYSPESFHHTELDYALEICEAVADEWGPTPEAKMIVNLPTTVEQFPPNVYADRIEWFGRHFSKRDAAILSVHPHNDRGTAVATAELGLMAGAERVEGTLFGNGERTGNVDLVTIALNLLTQGVDPRLDLSGARRGAHDRRGVQRAAGPSAPSVGRRARLHRVLGLAPGRDQEGDARAGAVRLGRVGRPVPADRPEGRRARLRGDHPRQLAVGEGRRRVPHADRAPPRPSARAPGRLRAEGAGDHRRPRRRAHVRGADGGRSRRSTSTTSRRSSSSVTRTRARAGPTGSRPTCSSAARSASSRARATARSTRSCTRSASELGVEIHVLDYHEHAMSRGEDAIAAAYVEADVDGERRLGRRHPLVDRHRVAPCGRQRGEPGARAAGGARRRGVRRALDGGVRRALRRPRRRPPTSSRARRDRASVCSAGRSRQHARASRPPRAGRVRARA